MIQAPEIVKTEALTTARIYQVVPANQIQRAMGKTLNELRKAIEDQGKTITGPWFTHHIKPPAENFDFEVCFPISDPVEPEGRMEPGEWPAMSLVRTVYRGSYEGLPSAWAEFKRRIEAQGYSVRSDIWERYLAGPETSPDVSKWETELSLPLAEP